MSEKKSSLKSARKTTSKTASTPVIPSPVPWDDLSAFLAIARHGGLSSAAREIASSAPTLGRRMRALERALGRELFVRRTHGYGLTQDGLRLRDQLNPVEETIARATLPKSDSALPLVKIAAGTWTAFALAGMLSTITGDPADLRVRLLQGEDILSIPRREAAIGFRSHRPTDIGLAGRRLRQVQFAPFAAFGAQESWIVVRTDTPSARWVAERCGDKIVVEVNTPRLSLDFALKGLGWVMLPTFVGDNQGGLERVGSVVNELTHDQWLVSHDDDRDLPEIRRALDRIGDSLS